MVSSLLLLLAQGRHTLTSLQQIKYIINVFVPNYQGKDVTVQCIQSANVNGQVYKWSDLFWSTLQSSYWKYCKQKSRLRKDTVTDYGEFKWATGARGSKGEQERLMSRNRMVFRRCSAGEWKQIEYRNPNLTESLVSTNRGCKNNNSKKPKFNIFSNSRAKDITKAVSIYITLTFVVYRPYLEIWPTVYEKFSA